MSATILVKNSQRVSRHTAEKVNERIKLETLGRLALIGSDKTKIRARLEELDAEWDIERAIETGREVLGQM